MAEQACAHITKAAHSSPASLAPGLPRRIGVWLQCPVVGMAQDKDQRHASESVSQPTSTALRT